MAILMTILIHNESLESVDYVFLIGMLTANSFAMAVQTTIINGMMVIESRKDSKYGSEDLETFSWIFLTIGGIFCNFGYSLIQVHHKTAAELIQGCQMSFILPLLITTGTTICALFITKDIDGDSRIIDMTFKKRLNFNWTLVKDGVKLQQMKRTLIYYLIMAFVTPNFSDFRDYFYNYSGFWDGLAAISLFFGILISTICFQVFLKDVEIRSLQIVSISFNIVNCCLNICLVLGVSFGLSEFTFVCIQSFFFDSVYQAYAFLPVFVVFTKLVSYQVEGSMFALLTGISAASTLVYGRLLGAFYSSFINITATDYSQMWILMTI